MLEQLIARVKRWDRQITEWSPNHDVLLLRLVVALIAVVFLAIGASYEMPFFFGLGLPFYLACLTLYAHGLFKSLLILRQVSAELLIVLVMVVTLLDGKPLSGALVAWFIGLGLYISFTIIRRNREKIERLVNEAKRSALVLVDGDIREVAAEQVKVGDMLIVPGGTAVPVDGVIVEGKSSLDESFVTGEPFPVCKAPGDEVVSGTLNLSAPLQVRATRDGDASFLAVIAAEIGNSLQQKSALQRRADKIVQYLILGVSGYSLLLFLVSGSLDLMATALSVVCPCAWALATPTVFASGIGRTARLNILSRSGEALDIVRDVHTVILDKTGTVTLAEPTVSAVLPIGIGERELLTIAASAETRFSHPLARAIVGFARAQGIDRYKPVTEAEVLPGRGIKALIDGAEVLIGSPETLAARGLSIPAFEHSGRAVWIAVEREIKGAIVVHDVMRSEMRLLADKIRELGVRRVLVATGDHEESEAKRVADVIGADGFFYNFKPADKAELVKREQAFGPVAMVGDGLNDAPALAAADVGIAIGGHKNVALAIASADIVILGDDASALMEVLKISRKMAEIVEQNYTWAISFNAVGLSLATFGLLNPVLAAFFHHLSSVFVVANSARLYAGFDTVADMLERVKACIARYARD